MALAGVPRLLYRGPVTLVNDKDKCLAGANVNVDPDTEDKGSVNYPDMSQYLCIHWKGSGCRCWCKQGYRY